MINNINKLPEVQFIKIFSNFFENSQFIAEALYKKRISNSLDEEFSNCLNEVKLIAKLRLKEIETNIE